MDKSWLLTFGGPLGNFCGVVLGITLGLSASASIAPLWYLFAFINATYFVISLLPIPNSDGSILMEQLFPSKKVKQIDPRFAFKLHYFVNGAMFGYTIVSLYRAANGV